MKKLLLLSLIILSGCSLLPSSGPNHKAIIHLNQNVDEKTPEVLVVDLDNLVAQRLAHSQIPSTFADLEAKNSTYSGVLAVGDELEISIWEAPPAVLFGSTMSVGGDGGAGRVSLPHQVISKQGTITVPFVGLIKVAGKTTEQVQSIIIKALWNKANKPQALVNLAKNNSASVMVVSEGKGLTLPLTNKKERILDAISAVGGANGDITEIAVQLTRGKEVRRMSLEKLIANSKENIYLKTGDVITFFHNPYSFISLGAVGTAQEIRFSVNGLTLSEAMGRMRGLLDERSDPRGIFVFRHTPFNDLNKQQKEEWRAKGYKENNEVPTVYRLDLLQPQSFFAMQKFPVHDKDVIYVSNAPMAEFQKFIRMIFSLTSPVLSTHNNLQ